VNDVLRGLHDSSLRMNYKHSYDCDDCDESNDSLNQDDDRNPNGKGQDDNTTQFTARGFRIFYIRLIMVGNNGRTSQYRTHNIKRNNSCACSIK